MQKKIAVVTGGSGFIGSHLVDHLLSQGYSVKCIIRKSSNTRWLKGKDLELIDCGLFDKEKLKVVLKDADYLFHIAGVVKSKDEKEYFDGNVETTRTLLNVLVEVNPGIKRIVISSSLTASGPSLDGKPSTEETPEHPITTYGRSKLEQERVALSYKDKLPISIVRLHAVYGERDTEIYQFFKTYKMGLMALIGFNDKHLNLVHVDDAVSGIYLASTSEKAIGQIYFIASEEIYDWPLVGEIIGKAFGKKAFTLRIPHFIVYTVAAVAQFFAKFSSQAATFNIEKARDFVQKEWTCDVSKAKRDLGFRQNVALDKGIERAIAWYREMKWL
ncbi:MAG: NAD-dependent epimerase/dehydratase family protein [bacterium]